MRATTPKGVVAHVFLRGFGAVRITNAFNKMTTNTETISPTKTLFSHHHGQILKRQYNRCNRCGRYGQWYSPGGCDGGA